jgi:growth arrest-specific protein 8
MLDQLIPQMKDKLKDLSMKRNYFQLERDTIDGFRNMSEKEVQRLEGLSKLRDLELEEIMENQRVELEVYAHKVRHLKYETDVDVSKVRAEADRVVSENHAAYRSKVERAEKGKVAALAELEDNAEIAHDAIAKMQAQNELELNAVREKHATALANFKETCRRRMQELVENLDISKRVELQEIEDRKNLHLQVPNNINISSSSFLIL